MTEEIFNKTIENKASYQNNKRKKSSFLAIKILLIVIIFFCGFIGFEIWKKKRLELTSKENSQEKSDSPIGEIFDLSDDFHKQKDADMQDLSDAAIAHMKEKGIESIYKILFKNQIQINEIKDEISSLKVEFLRYKNREKIGKMIFSYVDLRQKIFVEEVNKNELENSIKNFEILAMSDDFLNSKFVSLKANLSGFKGKMDIKKSFLEIIPNVIIAKSNTKNSGFASFLHKNLSKLIIVRRVDGKGDDVDILISKAEKMLLNEDYQGAFNILMSLDSGFHDILSPFLVKLSIAAEIKKSDDEFMKYLKSLT